MALFKTEAEKQAEREQRAAGRASAEAEKAAREFAKTPAGQARVAREHGDGLFQITLSVGEMNQRLPGLSGVSKRARLSSPKVGSMRRSCAMRYARR